MRRRLKLKKYILILGLFLTLTLFQLSDSFAFTEYYVDFENGTDGARTCTDANPASDECKTLQYALDTVTAQAGGSRINVEWDSAAMTQTLAASIDVDTNAGTADNPIIVQGYSSTVGDGVRAIIDGDSAATNIFNVTVPFTIYKDLEIKGSTGDAFNLTGTSDNATINNIKITTAGDEGILVGASSLNTRIISCEISSTGDGIELDQSAISVLYNYIHDTSGIGINSDSSIEFIIGNVIDTTTIGISLSNDRDTVIGNTVYNSTGAGNDNINISSGAEGTILINNILNTSAGDSLEIAAGGNSSFYLNNAIETKSGTIFFESGESTADPQFEGAAGGNFNIGANLDNLGLDTATVNTASTTTSEPGAYPYEETGGGSSAEGTLILNGVSF